MFLKFLKKYFIPHEDNDHKPHFLRSETTVIILGIILFIELVFLFQTLIFIPKTNFFASILPAVLVDETNTDRKDNNQEPLKLNPLLEQAAQLKAEDMVKNGYFSHNSPDGKTPWYWLEQVGYDYVYAGENLAVNFIDSEDVILAWMNSPAHRANILNEKFSEIGIAAARGIYEGRETTFIVQFFGRPTSIVVRQAPPEERTATESVSTSAVVMTPEIKGETIELEPATTVNHPSPVVNILAKPRSVNTYLYLTILTLVTLALLLNVFIKIRIQHPLIIANGIFIFAIVGFAYLVNYLVGLYHAQIF